MNLQPLSPEKTETLSLPEIIDRPGTLFVYGSLVQNNAKRINRIAKGLNMGIAIHFCKTIQEAQVIDNEHPEAVIVLQKVAVPNLKMAVVAVGDLEMLFERKTGGLIAKYNAALTPYFEAEDLAPANPKEGENFALYGNLAKPEEKSLPIQGALMINMPDAIIEILNKFELYDPKHPELSVYQPLPLSEVRIEGQSYAAKNVHCYGATIENIHGAIANERTVLSRVLESIRKSEEQGRDKRSHLWWPSNIRRGK